jgi:hypothetical protein
LSFSFYPLQSSQLLNFWFFLVATKLWWMYISQKSSHWRMFHIYGVAIFATWHPLNCSPMMWVMI